MAKLTINGETFKGDHIKCVNNQVWVDGKLVEHGEVLGPTLDIHVTGGLASLVADGSVVCGDVGSNVSAGGSVKCDVVGGNVSAGGSIKCHEITGNVSAGGSVKCIRS